MVNCRVQELIDAINLNINYESCHAGTTQSNTDVRQQRTSAELRWETTGEQPWASLPMATPPQQKSSQVESSIESGKFLKLSSQVLDIRVHLNSTFGVEYFE